MSKGYKSAEMLLKMKQQIENENLNELEKQIKELQ